MKELDYEESIKMLESLLNISKKYNEYDYYHICIYKDEKIIKQEFDLSFKDVIDILENNKPSDFKVIGTTDSVDLCLKYINEYINSDIIGCDLEREDIFKSEYKIFVNLTNAFTKIIK